MSKFKFKVLSLTPIIHYINIVLPLKKLLYVLIRIDNILISILLKIWTRIEYLVDKIKL